MGKYDFDSTKETAEQYKARHGLTSGELDGAGKSTSDTVTEPDGTGRISQFGAALNVAIDKARQQRKDKTMDFMNGVVPPGALPASSFASVLSAFNSDSAPLEAGIVGDAMDFAKQQEQAKIDAKNDIRELGLAVAKAGGKPEVLSAVLSFGEAGDVDGAIKAAAAALASGNKDIRQVGSNIVEVSPDGTVKVLYTSGGGSPTSGGYTATQKLKLEAQFGADWAETSTREEQVKFLSGGTKDEDWLTPEPSFPLPEGVEGPIVELSSIDFFEAPQAEIDKEMNRLLGTNSAYIKKQLTQELQKDFMNDWIYMQEAASRPIDPLIYFNETWGPAAGISPKTTEKDDEEDDTRDPLGK
jgi:hypothetical protein